MLTPKENAGDSYLDLSGRGNLLIKSTVPGITRGENQA